MVMVEGVVTSLAWDRWGRRHLREREVGHENEDEWADAAVTATEVH